MNANGGLTKFESNGTETLSITSEGQLNLAGNMQFTAADPELEFNNGGPRFRVPAANTLTIHTGGGLGATTNERLRITSDGIIRTPNLQGNNHREIHRKIDGFNSGGSVVNYLLICQTDRTNVRLAGRLLTARASGSSACAAQLFDITFQQNHNATHRSGAIMGLHSGSNSYGHAEAEFVSLTYNSTNYYAIRFSSGWVTDFDTCSFDGIREHLGTELFTHIDSTNDTITNVSVLDAATDKGDVTIQQADLRISDGDIIMPSGHGISFSATANATGMSSEVLDDYEEGTWTPTFSNGVTSPGYNLQSGTYTKIGNLVTFALNIRASSGTAAGVPLRLSGLPFTSSSSKDNGGAFFNYRDDLTTNVAPFLHVGKNQSMIQFYTNTGSVWNGTDGNGIINRNLHINGYYYV